MHLKKCHDNSAAHGIAHDVGALAPEICQEVAKAQRVLGASLNAEARLVISAVPDREALGIGLFQGAAADILAHRILGDGNGRSRRAVAVREQQPVTIPARWERQRELVPIELAAQDKAAVRRRLHRDIACSQRLCPGRSCSR